uniref:Transmembrane protein 208 n=1 Tax=Ditylum brightwellii TaxID=49249 RepID=A0A6V2GWK8_9STRA|mmetsp:Transcript_23958/g.35438  ORF Transcript_23958/g.35438 Transcript_23958/m.35438 type:complete len:182 (-) Transcript_23958:332-877(-)
MAQAAAKKAAAARASASSTYFPIVLIINAIYALLRIGLYYQTYTWTQFGMSCILWALTYISYRGIVEDHADKASVTIKATGKKSKELAGGASLDLLGLVACVQFGTALFSDRFFWLLAILPFWGGWKLYQTFYGGGENGGGGLGSLFGGGGGNQKDQEEEVDEATKERRQKRAERRRMKRF